MERRPRILIVDDEPEFAHSLQAAMAARSYETVVATTRLEAQEKVRIDEPDAVVIGTIMPRGDAYLLHRWLRSSTEFQNLPMIVVDASVEKQVIKGWRREEGLRLEADDYLIKPVNPEAMVPLIEKLLDKGTERIKVLVVDDHAIVRDGIRALLSVQKDMHVVGEAVDGVDAVEKVHQYSPDVVLMDIVMPRMNGLEAAKMISKQYEGTRVVMLSQYDDEENVLASTRAGARGFVPKGSASTHLLSAIRSAN